MAGTATTGRTEHRAGSEVRQLRLNLNKIITDLETLRNAVGGASDTAGLMPVVDELITDHGTFKTAVDGIETLIEEMHDDHALMVTAFTNLADRVNLLTTELYRDGVVDDDTDMTVGCGLDVDDGSAVDLETNNAIVIRHRGLLYPLAADAAYDTATATANGDTITQNKSGVFWVFADPTAQISDVESPLTPQAYSSAVEALTAGWYGATNTLPPSTIDVCIGAVQVTENNSGTWTFGTDSITDETEAYYSLIGWPGVEVVLSAFTIASGSAAKWDYGTATIRLGTGTRVALTGETEIVLTGSNVATTKSGLWIVCALADDTVYAHQLGAAYASATAAIAAFEAATPNPLLPVIGYFVVDNQAAGNFVPGTTLLNATDVTTTFYKVGPGQEVHHGKGGVNAPIDALAARAGGPASLTSPKPASAPATLTKTNATASTVNAASDMTAATVNA